MPHDRQQARDENTHRSKFLCPTFRAVHFLGRDEHVFPVTQHQRSPRQTRRPVHRRRANPRPDGPREYDADHAEVGLVGVREMGRRRMLLGTNAGNVRAIAFYRRNGFVEAGTRTFVVGMQQCCDAIFGKVL